MLAPGSDRIPVELFQILKDDAVESAALNMKTLDPITLPMEMSELPAMAPVRLTTSSGQEVPKPTMVSPMTNSLIFSFLAIDEAPSTRKSAPKTMRSRPAASTNRSVNIIPICKCSQRVGYGGTYPPAERRLCGIFPSSWRCRAPGWPDCSSHR